MIDLTHYSFPTEKLRHEVHDLAAIYLDLTERETNPKPSRMLTLAMGTFSLKKDLTFEDFMGDYLCKLDIVGAVRTQPEDDLATADLTLYEMAGGYIVATPNEILGVFTSTSGEVVGPGHAEYIRDIVERIAGVYPLKDD